MPKKTDYEIGRKKPQINIPLDRIELDSQNPRLAEEHQSGTQLDILKVLYNEFDLEEIAFSMAENGYFEEEPIVAVPKNIPSSFNWDLDIDKLQDEFEKLIKNNQNIRFIVIEGNRRIATAKLLTDQVLRDKVQIRTADFPSPKNSTIESDLKIIPSIIYKNLKDVSPYLGVRHITGVLKWEAYAKAKYIAARIEEESKKNKNIEQSIQNVQKKIGDRSDTIKKQYMYYKIFDQAKNELDSIDAKEIINRFSLITVAINSPSIREYIGVPSYKEANLQKPLIPKNKLQNLEILLTWIFGNGKDKTPILTDSRKITSHLAPILADKEATKYLLDYNSLEEAYERSGGDKEFLKKKIKVATRAIKNALQTAYKYKGDKEIVPLWRELDEAIGELKKAILK
ncbi:MAG: hypothetical protein LLF92_03950 [Planctomycetaceae bacterium]|nr:hypothetical protein [Planctomycetaceae bacterium]